MNIRTSLRALVFVGSCIVAAPGCGAPVEDDDLASGSVALDEGNASDAWTTEPSDTVAASRLEAEGDTAVPTGEGDNASLLAEMSSLGAADLDLGVEGRELANSASLSSCTPALIGTQYENWVDIGCGGRRDTTCCWGFSCTTYYNACYLERFQRRNRSIYRSWDCSTTYGSWNYEYKLESRPVCH
ncbi:hypothetical protein WME79_03955 [Sorangium sp. So ce726]|uniref:hypothetical protein n=1 Tax=Sorangium sp. So ce726 TaxID=3133319 RepID=UPI003F5F88CA